MKKGNKKRAKKPKGRMGGMTSLEEKYKSEQIEKKK